MKRLRSYGDDLGSVGEKELDRTASMSSSHHRRFYLKPTENGGRGRLVMDDDRDRDMSRALRKRIEHDLDGFDDRDGVRSSRKRMDHDFGDNFDDREGLRSLRKRMDHDLDGFDDREGSRSTRKRMDHDLIDNFDEREGSRVLRKRFEHEIDGFERRKGLDRYREREGSDRGGMVSSLISPRGGYVGERERDRERDRERERDRIHRSESFSVGRREFPKGFRSERDRSKREDSVSSWRRLGSRSKRDCDEEVKSSVGERAASSSSRGGPDGGSSRESLRSPQRLKDVRSPTWSKESKESKDSGGESLKTVKKTESLAAESGGSINANDIEEGELEPEPHQEPEPQSAAEQAVKHVAEHGKRIDVGTNVKMNESECCQKTESVMEDPIAYVKSAHEEKALGDTESSADEMMQLGFLESAKDDAVKVTVKKSVLHDDSVNKSSGGAEVKGSEVEDGEELANCEKLKEDDSESLAQTNCKLGNQDNTEGITDMCTAKSLTSARELKVAIGIDLEVQVEDVDMPKSSKAMVEEDQKEPELCMHSIKDKGKGLAVCSSDEVMYSENGTLIERNFIACQDDAMEGPSTRGFELFSSCVGLKANQAIVPRSENEKLKLEPLDLSLGLPNVTLPVPSNSAAAPPNSPPRARSVQSLATTFRTGSDGFTASISFSGSQFVHNPSCSLTHNSVDYDFEQSVKSRPLFQGVDWQACANDSKNKEVSIYPKILPSINGSFHPSHASQGMFSGQSMQGQQGIPFGLDQSVSFQRQISGIKARYHNDIRSPTQSAGSHDTKSECGRDKKRAVGEESGSTLFKSNSQRDMEQGIARDTDFLDRIIGQVASEPLQTMAWRIHEMSEQAVACLRERTCEIVVNEEKRGKLHALQEALQNRSDLTLETLLKSPHVQLEILVALKTGLPDFLRRADDIPSTDLAEIFLNLKCRNPNCGSALPVDECYCKFCSSKDGFCSTCMCLVCSKFDTALNTCSWVGCDVCSHWCHTDCGLRKSYIRNGRSANAGQGTSEMQFYCVACDLPSEMFGFVKDVFIACASHWNSETMLKELEYVKRIFSASNDVRGKVLYDIANQLLTRLKNGSSVMDVYNQIMGFLAESDSKFSNASGSTGRELHNLDKNKGDGSDRAAGHSKEASWFRAISVKDASQMENARAPILNTEGSSGSRGIWASEMQMGGKNKPVVDELESIVKISRLRLKCSKHVLMMPGEKQKV
ncbi:hypothetical protein Ancab_000142 [Ancistrocladus abbreviatus]